MPGPGAGPLALQASALSETPAASRDTAPYGQLSVISGGETELGVQLVCASSALVSFASALISQASARAPGPDQSTMGE